jgi:DNA-binding FadR family transcriptional regulator
VADAVQPIRVPKAAALVAADLRRQIVRGAIEAGTALPNEADLTRIYDVSRPTVREALRILESEGLIGVVRGAGGGARVGRPSASMAARYAALVLQTDGTTLADVFAARTVIEPAAVRLLAATRDDHALGQLRALHDAEMAVADEPERFPVAAARFHEALIELAGSNTLTLIGRMLLEFVESNNRATMQRLSGRARMEAIRDAGHQHERVLELIEAGDGVEAERVWRAHLVDAADVALRSLGRTTVIDLLD